MSFIQLNTSRDLDIISDIKFQNSNNLLVSSWSNEIYLFQTQTFIQSQSQTHSHFDQSQLDPLQIITTSNSTPLSLLYHPIYQKSLVGNLDGSVNEIDSENNKLIPIIKQNHIETQGEVSNGINKLSLGIENSIISGSFNGHLQVIDPRTNSIQEQIRKDYKIFNMESFGDTLIIGSNKNIIEIYDLRKGLNIPTEIREVGLKYQIKDLKICHGEKFAISTIDGRVSIEYLKEQNQDLRFTFKCHRTKDKITDIDLVYPVNSIAFQNEQYLYTGGSDGYVCLWDCSKKKRIKQYKQFINIDNDIESIQKLTINNDSNLLVVGTSDDNYYRRRRLSQSENTKNPSKIYIKSI